MAGKKERQRRLARERYQRRAAKRARKQELARRWAISGLAAVVVVALGAGGFFLFGGLGKSTPPAKPTPSTSPTAAAEPAHHCTYIKAGTASRKVSLPSATPDYSASYRATIHTNRGDIVIDLLNSKATCTVNSFVHLAAARFFNSTPCWRISTSASPYMLQCGSTSDTGSGGPGYEFASENLTGAKYPAGTVAMANSGTADSNGSQFFLVYKNSTGLSASYTPFGEITSGLNILRKVASHGYGRPYSSAGGGKPKESVTIKRVTITKT
jgi:peptidyl-prolyl cis-trans isomerase B (cyclophilin B)